MDMKILDGEISKPIKGCGVGKYLIENIVNICVRQNPVNKDGVRVGDDDAIKVILVLANEMEKLSHAWCIWDGDHNSFHVVLSYSLFSKVGENPAHILCPLSLLIGILQNVRERFIWGALDNPCVAVIIDNCVVKIKN